MTAQAALKKEEVLPIIHASIDPLGRLVMDLSQNGSDIARIDPVTLNIPEGETTCSISNVAATARLAAAECMRLGVTPILLLPESIEQVCIRDMDRPTHETAAQYIGKHFNFAMPERPEAKKINHTLVVL